MIAKELNQMLNHRIIFVSKDTNFKVSRNKAAEISKLHPEIRFDYVQNNVTPLPALYNAILDEDETKKYDYVYMAHADIDLDFGSLAENVESVKDKYDVIGLCGCAKFSVSQTPLNWFCGSRPFPEARWGCVTHGELGNQTSFFSQHSPSVQDHEVACIDGLCIIFTKKAIESGLRFDDSLSAFDFYDTDISMQAVLKYGLKLGVIVRKDLIHYSVGKSILTVKFLESESKFRKKWKFAPPEDSPVAKMMTTGQV